MRAEVGAQELALSDIQGQRETAQGSLARTELLLKQANEECEGVLAKVKGQREESQGLEDAIRQLEAKKNQKDSEIQDI